MPADCALYGYPGGVFDSRREGTEVLRTIKLRSGPVDVRKDPACSGQIEEHVERYYNRDFSEREILLIKLARPRTDGCEDLSAIYRGKRCVVVDKQIVPRGRPEVWQFRKLLLDGL